MRTDPPANVSDDRYEREADAFAAGLLMPGELFKNVAARVKPGPRAVELCPSNAEHR